MNVHEIKQFIFDNGLIETVLEAIDCRSIKDKGDYYTCGNYNGDNPAAITVYKNEMLTVVNYTRDMVKGKRSTDIIDLVMFNTDVSFPKALKFLCDLFSLDYYSDIEEPPESLQILQLIKSMSTGNSIESNEPLKPISDKILQYYLPYPNKLWLNEGISLGVQHEFGCGYDPASNRITLPLYDSLGQLVGVKGRLMKPTEDLLDGEQKYLYMTKFNKSKFLFGLNKTYEMIQKQNYVLIFESEKSVMLAYEHGIGATAACGCKLSSHQVEEITRMNVPIVLCLDKDRTIDDIKEECNKFLSQIPIYFMFDKDNILDAKQSPIDDWDKFITLRKNNVYKHERKEN